MRYKHILVQVRYTDRSHLGILFLFSPILHVDRKHAVEIAVHERERLFTIRLVSLFVHIFDNKNVVNDSQVLTVKSLTAYVPDTNEYIFSLSRVRYSSNQLRLRIKKHEFMLLLQVVKSNTAHGTAVAHEFA